MVRYEWRVSLVDGVQSVRLSGQGIWIGEEVLPWSKLTDVGFVRYQTRSGLHEELSLWFGPDDRRTLRWMGAGRSRAAWREMLVAFAAMASRQRPDLTIADGPDAQAQQAARWIGLGVAAAALGIMGVTFAVAESLYGGLAGAWIGIVGSVVGGLVYAHYARRGPPPRLDWDRFAKREGQSGELPAN